MTIVLVVAGGCASSRSGPVIVGSIGVGTHTVSVGDEVVIRIPGDPGTGAAPWRVSSYDSVMLRLAQAARPATGSDGRTQWTVRFVARTPGNSDIVLTRVAVGTDGTGEIGERRRFKIRIRDW